MERKRIVKDEDVAHKTVKVSTPRKPLSISKCFLLALSLLAACSEETSAPAPNESAPPSTLAAAPALAPTPVPPTPTSVPPTATAVLPTATPMPEPITMGTTVEAEGSKYTVHELRDPAPVSRFWEVEEGKRLVAVNVTQEGVTEGDASNPLYFSVQDEDGYVYQPKLGGTELDPQFGSGDLSPGKKRRGWIAFEIPRDAVIVSVWAEAEIFGTEVSIADLTASN